MQKVPRGRGWRKQDLTLQVEVEEVGIPRPRRFSNYATAVRSDKNTHIFAC